MLTGQVATHRLKSNRKVRQVGFQETDMLSIFSSITKYQAQLSSPEDIVHVLESAYSEAVTDRPGPVHIDLPDDLQRADVTQRSPHSVPTSAPRNSPRSHIVQQVAALMDKIRVANRPAIVLGGGFSTPRLVGELREVLRQLNVPVLLTWAGIDLIPFDWKGRVGTFGVYGSRLGNFVIQNADLLICLGTRLSQNLTGGVLEKFAPGAHIAMIDIDRGELDKFDGYGIKVETRIHSSMQEFLAASALLMTAFSAPDIKNWVEKIDRWRSTLPTDIPEPPHDSLGYVDANHFVRQLSDVLAEDELIFVDTGGNLTWTCNNLRVKKNQRVISAWNFTPMGYSLPASIGGAMAAPDRPITCIIGDGGLQLCLGEIATIVHHKLPIRIVLFNNHAHGIQKQTLETWLDGRYTGVDPDSGLGLCDFQHVVKAMGIPVIRVTCSSEISAKLRDAYAKPGPLLLNIEINPDQKLYPVLKSGSPLENQMPFLGENL
jgi:acetolactate synthase-1/2/3 large subunit